MANSTNPTAEEQFSVIIGRVFSDQNFAKAMEQNPEKALQDAGYKLDEHQLKALKAGSGRVANVAPADANVAAFVRPVVSVLTKGTQPAVQVVVSSAVVATKTSSEER